MEDVSSIKTVNVFRCKCPQQTMRICYTERLTNEEVLRRYHATTRATFTKPLHNADFALPDTFYVCWCIAYHYQPCNGFRQESELEVAQETRGLARS